MNNENKNQYFEESQSENQRSERWMKEQKERGRRQDEKWIKFVFFVCVFLKNSGWSPVPKPLNPLYSSSTIHWTISQMNKNSTSSGKKKEDSISLEQHNNNNIAPQLQATPHQIALRTIAVNFLSSLSPIDHYSKLLPSVSKERDGGGNQQQRDNASNKNDGGKKDK